MTAAAITDAATESVLAEYDRVLLDTLGIFGSYFENIDTLNEKLTENINKMLSPEKEFVFLNSSNFYNLSLTNAACNDYLLITDDRGRGFYEQALSYMRDNIPSVMIDFLKNYVNGNESVEDLDSYYENEEKSVDEKIDSYLKDAAGEGSATENDQEIQKEPVEIERSPIDVIKEIKKKGVLSLVVPENKSISENEIELDACVSYRKDFNRRQAGVYNNDLTEKALFVEYLADRFPSYTDDQTSTGLSYKLEYCLAGKASDLDNLKFVVNRLLVMKEAVNFAYLMTDEVKKAEALALSAALTAVFGIEPLVEVMKYGILLAWAYGESILDVKNLLSGGSSALIKTSDNWKLSLENIDHIADFASQPIKESNGLKYETYLKLMLMFMKEEELCFNGMDMAEDLMRDKYNEKAYRLDHLLISLTNEASYESRSVFMNFRFMTKYRSEPGISVISEYSYT